MTSQFKDILTHTQKYKTVIAYFVVYGFKFCVKFQRCPLKFYNKFWIHTSQHMHFTTYKNCRLMISWSYHILSVSETGPRCIISWTKYYTQTHSLMLETTSTITKYGVATLPAVISAWSKKLTTRNMMMMMMTIIIIHHHYDYNYHHSH